MPTAVEILKKYWGYPAFRSPQDEIIQSVLEGKDVLALLPTGAGKSICYQVPALMGEGLCLVISPLIALMKDQVQQLKRRDISAAAIFSGLKEGEIDGILNNCAVGHTRILYVSPERLASDRFVVALRGLNVSMLAVDEAHCISQWGHDFRPSYREIAKIKEIFPHIPVIALTASATPKVQADIVEVLQLRKDFARFQSSFARPNIFFAVRRDVSKPEKMLEILEKIPGTAIIYARNRKRTEDIAKFLERNRISATYYHAGLTSSERNQRQEAWIGGKCRVISCTNAFGMGIDKPDVRLVIHADVPESLEAYYQEAGRAGRDGKPSYAVLLCNEDDKEQLEQQLEQKFPSFELVKIIYNALYNYLEIAFGGGKFSSFEFNIIYFSRKYHFETVTVFNALKLLEQAGYLQLSESFHMPSRISIPISTSDLYKFQVSHPDLDPFIKLLLRTYEGLVGYYVNISEMQLAQKMQVPVNEVIRKLKMLSKFGVMVYIPATDSPRITFLEERLPEDYLRLDFAYIAFSKEQMQHRLGAMLAYSDASSEQCLQVIMQNYFGEMNAKACGKCDPCIKRKYLLQKPNDEVIRKRLLDKIGESGLIGVHIDSVLENLGVHTKEHYLEVLRMMLDEEQVFWKNKKMKILEIKA